MYVQNNVFDNAVYRRKRKQFKNKIEIVNTGSGPSYFGIDMSEYTDNYLSLAKWPQSLEFDLRMLRVYEDILKEGCIVIIMITYPLSFGKYYKTKKEKQYTEMQYAHYMKYQDDFDVSFMKYMSEHYFYVHSFPRKLVMK